MQIGQVIGPVLFGALLGEGGDRTIMKLVCFGRRLLLRVMYILYIYIYIHVDTYLI